MSDAIHVRGRAVAGFEHCGCGSTNLGPAEQSERLLKAPDGTPTVLLIERRACHDCGGGVIRRA